MRKLTAIIGALALTAVISACGGSNSNYDKTISAADAAMSELDIESAVENYEKILEIPTDQMKYGQTRHVIAQKLLDKALILQGQLSDLEDRTEEVLGKTSNLQEIESSELSLIKSEVQDLLLEMESFPQLPMYEQLKTLETSIAAVVTAKYDALVKEIEASITALTFDVAKSKNEELSNLESGFSLLTQQSKEFAEKIETEKEKYIEFPSSYIARNVPLYESEKGNVIFLGEGVKDGRLVLFYKFDGDARYAAAEIAPITKTIFSSGDYTEGNNIFYRNLRFMFYPDYVVAYETVSEDPSKQVVRLDYRFPFSEGDTYKTIKLDNTNPTTETLNAITAFHADEQPASITLKNDELTIQINKVNVYSNQVVVDFTATSKKDMNFNLSTNLFSPLLNEKSERLWNEQLFAGIAKQFSYEFEFNNKLPANETSLKFTLGKLHANIDLKTGAEFTVNKELLIQQVHYTGNETSINKYINQDSKAILTSVDGKSYFNGISFWQYEGWFISSESAELYYELNSKYSKLTVDIGIDRLHASGSSKLEIIGDGRLLQTFELADGAATIPVDLDISNVNTLEFKATQQSGENGYQRIILGNGYLHGK